MAIIASKQDLCLYDLLLRHRAGEMQGDIELIISNHDAAPPTHHSWMSSRISWFDITDDLPRFDEEPPEPALD